MGKLVNIFCSIFLALVLHGCIQRGYTNEYGDYVPKNPRFKLKDKPFTFPSRLDTVNIYKLVYEDYLGNLEFSLKDNIWPYYRKRFREITYEKFYSKGRCTSFSIPSKLENVIKEELTEKDLNPHYINKSYYIYDGKKIKVETFVYGEGYGRYVMLDFFLSISGDTLIRRTKNSKSIYIKEKLPDNWKKYPIDW